MVFIIAFHMGAAGAAWATVISQGISGILCLVYIVKAVPILHLHKEDWRPSGHLLKIQLAVGIPMALQYSITAIGTMMVQTALNLLGSTQVAAFTAANKIEQIVTQAYVAMGTTMATYCAQNIGAGKIKRIRQGFKSITIMGSIYSVVVAAIIMTVGKYMTYLFLSGDLTEIMHSVDIYLKCVGTFFIPLTVVNVYRNGIQGMGYGLLPMMAGVAELVGRGVVAMIAAGQKSYFGVCMASPAAWILASALLIVMYYYVIHQNEKRFAKYADEESNIDGAGNLYVENGSDVIYKCRPQDISWLNITVDTVISHTILIPDVTSLKTLTITQGDGSSYQIQLQNMGADNGKVLYDGKELDVDSFRNFYYGLISVEADEVILENLPDTSGMNKIAEIKFAYMDESKKSDMVTYYSESARKAYAVLDGNERGFRLSETQIDTVLGNLQKLINGEEIKARY